MSPSRISGTAPDRTPFEASLSINTLDANEDFYREVGLPSDKRYDGKELVIRAGAGIGFKLKVLGSWIINRGKDGGVRMGEKLDVFFAGEELIDPDTGKSLGASEELSGTVEVVRINPKVTYAKIVSEVDPVNGPINTGDIVRRPQAK